VLFWYKSILSDTMRLATGHDGPQYPHGGHTMLRNLLAFFALFSLVGPLAAHFVLIVPEEKDATKVRIILSDSLKIDGRINVARVVATKLFAFDTAGKATPLPIALDTGNNAATAEPGSAVLIGGTCEYGVVQRGESGGIRISHHPKYIVGDPSTTHPSLADRVPVEIVARIDGGKVRFQAMGDGRPLGKTPMTLLIPGSTDPVRVITDERGLTPTYDKRGRWGVHFLRSTKVTSEFQGRQYEELREYATLVIKW